VGRFFTTNVGAPYLARFWLDVGVNGFAPEVLNASNTLATAFVHSHGRHKEAR
jgi:hypothetical protein